MRKVDISHIIRHTFKRLHKISQRLLTTTDPDDLHQFRVEVKKLRALLRLIAYSWDRPQYSKIPGSLRLIYQMAGNIRDWQIFSKLLDGAADVEDQFPGFRIYIGEEVLKGTSKLLDTLNDRKYNYSESKLLVKLPRKIKKTDIVQFCLEKYKAIYLLSKVKDLSDSTLHQIRKNLKDILYVVGLFSIDSLSVFNLKISEAENLSSNLGRLNDIRIGLHFLISSSKKGLAGEEIDRLQSIRTLWRREKKYQKRKIIHQLKAIHSSM